MTVAAAYDSIASLYDQHWGRDFSQLAIQAIETQLLDLLPAGSRVLDLCCGTGLVLGHLERLGFEGWGVDESAAMLAIARRHAPAAHLLCADMASFYFDVPFPAAVSFYNSLNHARSHQHLAATLRNTAAHLTEGGHFLFDYVLPSAFANAWEWREEVEAEERLWTFQYQYEPVSGNATCVINQNASIHQTSFDPQLIHEVLAAAGLRIIRDTVMVGAGPNGGRRLVLTRKQ